MSQGGSQVFGTRVFAPVLQWGSSTSLWDWDPSGPHKPPRHGPFGGHVDGNPDSFWSPMANEHACTFALGITWLAILVFHVLLRGNIKCFASHCWLFVLAMQLSTQSERLMEEGHIEDEPSAVMESADYVHMYMHTYAYVCIYVCRSGARIPLS